ncbi:MAG: MBL fold metallo-hydrolase [Chloroflexota bacterium]
MLSIVPFVLGPVMTNTFLLADSETKEAAVIDPAWEGGVIVKEAEKHNWHIRYIWVTHAHFDHMAGTAGITDSIQPQPEIALHPDDLLLWHNQGGAPFFGIRIDPAPLPTRELEHGQLLRLGNYDFEVRHAPGHSPGHVMFYCAAENVLFSGDVIFMGSIGRTDLPGGDYDTLITSIRTQVLTLPEKTRILNGHGLETTVGRERKHNPFLTGGWQI